MSIEDIAQDVELQEWERRNTSRTGPRVFAPDHEKYGPEECDECGVEMHPVRRSYGYRICIGCAEAAELRKKRYRS